MSSSLFYHALLQMHKIHTHRNTLQQAWKCAQCGRGFTTQASLKQHLRIHAGVRDFVCSVCGRSLSDSIWFHLIISNHVLFSHYLWFLSFIIDNSCLSLFINLVMITLLLFVTKTIKKKKAVFIGRLPTDGLTGLPATHGDGVASHTGWIWAIALRLSISETTRTFFIIFLSTNP